MKKTIPLPIAIVIIVVCASLAAAIAWQYGLIPCPRPTGPTPTPPEESCEQLYEEIENDFDEANYCEQDSDCKPIVLGGPYIEFDCWKYVNKEVDENDFLRRVEEYDTKCDEAINDCMLTPEPTCVSGKCVYLEDETADCLERYPEVVYEDCIPGEFVDGWWGKILYPNTLDTSNIEHYIDAPAPDIVKQAGIASYVASGSTCQTTWFIKINGEWKKVDQVEFCNHIIDYNSSCDNCLLEWTEGCC